MVKVERIETPIPESLSQRRCLIRTVLVMAAVALVGLVALIHTAINGPYSVRDVLTWTMGAVPIFGAVSVAAQAALTGYVRSSTVQFNVIATADADTTATIPHTLGVIPDEVWCQWIDPAARISLWCETIASRDITNVVLTKATTAGSGAAPAQIRVIIRKPHSMVR